MPGSKESDVAMEERGEEDERKEGRGRRRGQEGAEREMTKRRRWKPEKGGEKDEIKDQEKRKRGKEGRTEGRRGCF